jgi:hypothetical protein
MKKFLILLMISLIVTPALAAASDDSGIEKEVQLLKSKRRLLESELRRVEGRIDSLEKQLNGGGQKSTLSQAKPLLM